MTQGPMRGVGHVGGGGKGVSVKTGVHVIRRVRLRAALRLRPVDPRVAPARRWVWRLGFRL